MFKRLTHMLPVLLCLLPVSAARADEALTEQQILHLFPGTFQALVRGKFDVTVTVARDGAIVGQIPGLEDHGRWTVKDGELCIVLPNFTRGKVECSAVVSASGWYRGRNVAFRRL